MSVNIYECWIYGAENCVCVCVCVSVLKKYIWDQAYERLWKLIIMDKSEE